MKLATLPNGTRDGGLVVVSRDLALAITAADVAPTLQAALDDWAACAPRLAELATRLEQGRATGALPFDAARALAPLPRAYQWLDGSAYTNHGEWMQKAFGKPPLDTSLPLMYQGMSDGFLGGTADLPLPDQSHGIDFEGEVAVVVDDVPMGTAARDALAHVTLVMLANDWSLRALQPREMGIGFGFVHAKPATSFAPVAVTPDELGEAWRGARVHLPLLVDFNGRRVGRPDAGGMSVGFDDLIAHAARTHRLGSGTVIGSGTVSQAGEGIGSAAIAEIRAIEKVRDGASATGFMAFGDRVRMEMVDLDGRSIFGVIDQRVVRA